MDNLIKKRNLDTDPQYFGSYLNMARHNVFMIINHITEKFKDYGYDILKDDKEIDNGKNILSKIFDSSNGIPFEEKWRVFNFLENRHHFPILKYFKRKLDTDYEGDGKFISQDDFFQAISNFLNIAFKELVNYRNSYTHFLAIDNNGNLLDRKIDIDAKIKNDIEGLFKMAPSFSFIRFSGTQKEEDYSHLDTYRLFEENSNIFTNQGLFFFICLFLERQYAIKFIKRFKGFKNETLPFFKATIQVFTAYTLRRPDEKIKNEDIKQTLLMEMLNELNKCPKELFKHLTDEDKKEFEPKLKDEKALSNLSLNSINYDTLRDKDIDDVIRELISLKRNDDRFPYFALRYLEETNALKNIRFQITLGKLTIKKYSKTILNEEQNRRVNEVINAFGKLSDFSDCETSTSHLKNSVDDSFEFEQYAPHYNMNNNKIGFYIFGDDEVKIRYPKIKSDNNLNQPSGFISINDLPKLILMEILEKGRAENLIKEYIEKNNSKILNKTELDRIKEGLAFIPENFSRRINDDSKILKGKKLKEETAKREDYFKLLKERREILNTKLKEYGLNANQLPSKVLDYLMNISEPSQKKIIHNSIRQIKMEIKERLFILRKEQEPRDENQKSGNKLKLGELATFLARDFIDMVIDKDLKAKITSPYFNKLQNKIAYFSVNKNEIIELADELCLFDKVRGHIFLTKKMIQDENGLIEFYKRYLEAKSEWIMKNLHKNKEGYYLPDNKRLPYTIEKLRTYKKDINLTDWISHKSQMPVNLPTSLFDDLLNHRLLNIIGTTAKTGMSNYLSALLKNDSQPFYDYKRKYNIKKDEKTFSIENLSSKEINKKYDKNVEANEKLIKFIKTKDRVMLLMCNELIKEDLIPGLKGISILLKNIHPSSDFNPLDTPITLTKEIKYTNKQKEEIVFKIYARDTEEWKNKVSEWEKLSKEEKEKNPDKKIWYAWTIKDFGRFNKILNDRRLRNLLDYFESNEIPFSLLEYELMEYDRIREKIFDNIFNIEKAICAKDLEGIKYIELQKSVRNFNEVQFGIYTKWLAGKNIQFENNFIKIVRNKFSHSEFPQIEFTKSNKLSKQSILEFEQKNQEAEYKGKQYISFSQQIYDKYFNEIEKIIQQIEKL